MIIFYVVAFVKKIIITWLPIIIVFALFPAIFASNAGLIGISFGIALYAWFAKYQSTNNEYRVLQYEPTGEYKQEFEQLTRDCGVNPEGVLFRYAYTNNQIALTMYNMVVIDPLIWRDVQQDPVAGKVIEVLEQHVLPSVAPSQKKVTEKLAALFSRDAQRFVFRHELGHVVDTYTEKKLLHVFLQAFFALYVGTSVALFLAAWKGLAVVAGMMVGGILDVALSYLYNVTLQLNKEKEADRFTVRYSTKQEILAAADFFEQHQPVLEEFFGKEDGLFAWMPLELRSGHQSGPARARYLRSLAQGK